MLYGRCEAFCRACFEQYQCFLSRHALIGIGTALVCFGSLFWLRASRHKEYDAPEDTGGELRSFVDDLEAANRPARSVRPRLDQIRDTRQY
jgi:hypothetical protein